MVDSQRAEAFQTPPRERIPQISRAHVAAMESSAADEVWVLAGMHHVLLRTVGRRSGREHKVALPFWRAPDGRRVVVASFSGAPQHPAWFCNLLDRAANPEVLVGVQGGRFWARADVLEGEEHERTWAALVADRPWYADYLAVAGGRVIPLVRLVELRPA